MKIKYWQLIPVMTLILACDGGHLTEQSKAEETVDSFAYNYFNWQFEQASRYVTPSSVAWLRYAASQVSQQDIDLLNAQAEAASYVVTDIELDEDGTHATAYLTVSNYLRMDSIGQGAHVVGEADFELPLEKEQDRWLVRMEALPQSGKRSRD